MNTYIIQQRKCSECPTVFKRTTETNANWKRKRTCSDNCREKRKKRRAAERRKVA